VRKTLVVLEYGSISIGSNELSTSDVRELRESSFVDIQRSMDSDQYVVTAKEWVGQFPIGDSISIRVEPKIPIANIFWMLDVALDLRSLRVWDDALERVASIEDVFEQLSKILARQVSRRIRKGLHRAYVERTEDIEVVRGRVDVSASVSRLRSAPRLICSFDEHTADTIDNQILLRALELASSVPIRDEGIAASVRRVRRDLAGAVSSRAIRPQDLVSCKYSRLTEDYRPLHALSRFFINHVGPKLDSGESEVMPFAVEMPKLFEEFVASWLNEHAPPILEFIPQYTLQMSANIDLKLRVDLVAKRRDTREIVAVLDTKYKAHNRPDTSDVGQVALYAHETGARRAVLIYPFYLKEPFRATSRDVEISSLGLDLSTAEKPSMDSFMNSLLKTIAPEIVGY
jgi:5-methylcytosine-specific restriction enzyme subunit McrC